MTYPNTKDTFRRVTADPKSLLKIGDQNNMSDTVEGIQDSLGLNPEGSFATVLLRLNDIDTQLANLPSINQYEYERTTEDSIFSGSNRDYELNLSQADAAEKISFVYSASIKNSDTGNSSLQFIFRFKKSTTVYTAIATFTEAIINDGVNRFYSFQMNGNPPVDDIDYLQVRLANTGATIEVKNTTIIGVGVE